MPRIDICVKVRIYPSKSDKAAIVDTMTSCMHACNFVSDYVYRTHDLGQSSMNDGTYRDIRSKFGLTAQISESVIRAVRAKYNAVGKSKAFRHKDPIRFSVPQCDEVYGNDFSFKKDGSVSINSKIGRLKMRYSIKSFERYFDGSWTLGTSKLWSDGNGIFFLIVSLHKEVDAIDPVKSYGVVNIVGIDRGLINLVTAYDSDGKTTFFSGGKLRDYRYKAMNLRKKLQKRGTPSSRRRLREIGHRENRYMRDVNHRVSKALVAAHPAGTVFVIEDLTGVKSRAMAKRGYARYEQMSWPYYDFEQKLSYKAEKVGSAVVKVDPAYTSQTCPHCGHIESANRDKALHRFVCRNCGYSSNDDRIGAINVWRRGLDFVIGSQAARPDLAQIASSGVASPSESARPFPTASIGPRCDANASDGAAAKAANGCQQEKSRAADGQSQAPASNRASD